MKPGGSHAQMPSGAGRPLWDPGEQGAAPTGRASELMGGIPLLQPGGQTSQPAHLRRSPGWGGGRWGVAPGRMSEQHPALAP